MKERKKKKTCLPHTGPEMSRHHNQRLHSLGCQCVPLKAGMVRPCSPGGDRSQAWQACLGPSSEVRLTLAAKQLSSWAPSAFHPDFGLSSGSGRRHRCHTSYHFVKHAGLRVSRAHAWKSALDHQRRAPQRPLGARSLGACAVVGSPSALLPSPSS